MPLPARIFAIADAFDAITSKRPYKEPKSVEIARKIIESDIVTHFCPTCTNAFLSIPTSELFQIQLTYDETTIFT
ncbi:HD domain-containing phosphohydrolase [Tepidibacillus marianensis]|uniref:HD-GYP domain-containing protein n=1 Tax=Tepidibacillus marianensis TaxID=3131995 RepID=UPI0030CB7EC1